MTRPSKMLRFRALHDRPCLGSVRTVSVAFGLLVATAIVFPTPSSCAEDQASPDASDANSTSRDSQSTDEVIRELIEKLGSDSYATRIRARDRLRMYGLEAFDALREAQYHEDVEILAASRYLIGSLHVSWSKESDPKEVREILREYGAQTESDRMARIDLLGRLPGRLGIEALARIARFERLSLLSRKAAMLVLGQPVGDGESSRKRLADRLSDVVGENQRDSCTWLVAYADDLRTGEYDGRRWEEVVAEFRERLDRGIDQEITGNSVTELVRVLASRAKEEDAIDAANRLVIGHIDLVPPSIRDLEEQTNWSLQEGFFAAIIALHDLHQHSFNQNAKLLYSVAEAHASLNNPELSEQLAVRAFETNGFPEQIPASEEEMENGKAWTLPKGITEHQISEIARAKLSVTNSLYTRGQFQWAEREHLRIQQYHDLNSLVGLESRRQLAMMLGEQLRHGEAADLLEPIVERIEKDRLYETRMMRWQFDSRFFRSLFHFEYAQSLLDNGSAETDLDAAKKELQVAYNLDTDNIDILIRMYRLDDSNDSNWKPTVLRQLSENREKLQREIAALEARRNLSSRDSYRYTLGQLYNQYAWLVANTEGDHEKALRWSQESLKLTRSVADRAARLDTCARCFYALGQVEAAIETQHEAMALDPHSPPMKRQLELFKTTREAS